MNSIHAGLGAVSSPLVGGLSYLLGRGGANTSVRETCKGINSKVPASIPTNTIPSTVPTKDECETMVVDALAGAATLKGMSAQTRADLARQCAVACNAATAEMVTETIKYKGSYETGRGEETIAWSATIGVLRELAETLEAIATLKSSSLPVWYDATDGRHKTVVFPRGLYQHMLFSGYSAELWFKDGPPKRCNPIDNGEGAWFLLGAGNQATVIGCDVAHLVFATGMSVICKLNPVNDYLLPHMNKAFAPLVQANIVQFCCGGVPIASRFVHDERLSGIHMTGSDKTYDAIQFGPLPGEQTNTPFAQVVAEKKASGTLNIPKPFVAELGCSTPYIICPGNWSASAIDFHARAVVSMCVHNAHYNCLAAQNIVTCASWPQRETFMDAIRRHLSAAQTRSPYYPGADTRLKEFAGKCKDGKNVFRSDCGSQDDLPWTVIANAAPDDASTTHTCCNEAWTCVLTEIAVPSKTPKAFLTEAVEFCNDRCWGTLSCAIFIPPDLEAAEPRACKAAVAALKYGSVVVNAPTGLAYFVTSASWGGYIGHTPQDIQSGIGQVHNTLLYADVEKSVIRAPWNSPVTPMWFHDNVNHEQLANAVIDFQTEPNMVDFTKVALAAVQG